MKREPCPAALVVEGTTPAQRCVVCRVESTERGLQSDGSAGPMSIVRERDSPAALFGYCLRALPELVAEVESLGPLASDEQRRIADAAERMGGPGAGYTECPSWRMEKDNTRAAKLVDLPGERRRYGPEGVRAA